jgi:hypothetical protein
MTLKPATPDVNGNVQHLSMTVTGPKVTQGLTFGEKVNAGVNAAGTVAAQGVGLIGGSFGGGVISAAVSSVTSLSNMPSPAASASYAATGVVNLGTNGSGLATTVGSNGGAVSTAGSVGSPNLNAGASNNNIGMMNNEISQMSAENTKMMATQIALQRENQVFTSVSNVLKTKHDTVKNSISNIR